ncbi:MAG TPA: sugar phosphate nucleotidyltransferase [Vicinamibacterales bacterium]|nr:sugar phosphate nucleotidyltransferase [Vicinamibacterales bacterium]
MNSSSPYVGAILAAGHGTRMNIVSESYPKPLIPVSNKPVMQHQIELMRGLGIRDIYVLIGHKGYEITRRFGNGESLGVHLTYVEQSRMLGIAHAVGHLERHCDRPFLLFLGDIFFEPRDLTQMLRVYEAQGATGAVLATKEEADPAAIRRNFSVVLAQDGRVTRVIEKPRHTTNRLKGVGMYLFEPTIFDSIRRTPRTAMRDEYEITDAVQVFIDDGYPVRTADVVKEDINLTTPQDMLRVNLWQAAKEGRMPLVGDGGQHHPGARIEHSVVGARVTIEHPVRITNCLVFEDTLIRGREDIENTVIMPHASVNCGALSVTAAW